MTTSHGRKYINCSFLSIISRCDEWRDHTCGCHNNVSLFLSRLIGLPSSHIRHPTTPRSLYQLGGPRSDAKGPMTNPSALPPLLVTHRIASFYPHHVHSKIGSRLHGVAGWSPSTHFLILVTFIYFLRAVFLVKTSLGSSASCFYRSIDRSINRMRLRWDCVEAAQFPSFF